MRPVDRVTLPARKTFLLNGYNYLVALEQADSAVMRGCTDPTDPWIVFHKITIGEQTDEPGRLRNGTLERQNPDARQLAVEQGVLLVVQSRQQGFPD